MSKSSPLLALSMTEALVVVAPFSNAFIKDWPPEHYRQLIELCVERGGVRAIVVGTSGQRELGNQIIRALPAPAVENRCGTMSWLELGALIDGSAAVVGNDSGSRSPRRNARRQDDLHIWRVKIRLRMDGQRPTRRRAAETNLLLSVRNSPSFRLSISKALFERDFAGAGFFGAR